MPVSKIDEHRNRKDEKLPDMCPYCGRGWKDRSEGYEEITLARQSNGRWSCYNDECWTKARQNQEYEYGMYLTKKLDKEFLKDLKEW